MRPQGGSTHTEPSRFYHLPGAIEELDKRPDPVLDEERCCYNRLTGLGQRVAAAEAQRLETLGVQVPERARE